MIKKTFRYLGLFLAVIRLSKYPNDTKQVFVMADHLYALGLADEMTKMILNDEKSKELVKSRKLFERIDLQALQKLPEQTLGRVYADHMIANGYSPDFFPIRQTINDMNYMIMRNRETHDLWHILTGFDTSPVGEIGLQGFMYAQIKAPLSSLLVGGSLIRAALGKPTVLPRLWDGIMTGYEMGIKAKPIYALDWEAHWATPISEVRSAYAIDPYQA